MRERGPNYSPPRIETIDGGAFVELLGPAQGYLIFGEAAPPTEFNLGAKVR